MELLKEILPKVSRVTVKVDAPNDIGQTKAAKDAARPWNINLQVQIVSGPAVFEIAFDAARKNRAYALIQLPSAFLYAHQMRLMKLAISYRLPAIHNHSDRFIGAGRLMSYAPNLA